MDLIKLRADTPGCLHRIHFNNAGASLPPMPVLRTMTDYLEMEALYGGYEIAAARAAEINGFYLAFARLVGAEARNMAYCESASDAFAMALSSIPFQRGEVILTTQNDYISNQIAFLSLKKRLGVEVLRAKEDADGGVSVEDFEKMLKKYRPRLAAVTHVPSNTGLIQPVGAIGKICRDYETLYLVDACQSVGQLPLDVQAIGCDFLSGTCRKFLRGPRGAGFLFVSDRALAMGLEPFLPDMRGAEWISADEYQSFPDARRFEYWEKSYALLLGSKVAAEYALSVGLENIAARNRQLCQLVREKLAELPGLRLLDKGKNLSAIITAHIAGVEPLKLKADLEARGINTSISVRQFARIDFEEKGVDWALRISPHYYNSEEEVEGLAAALQEIL